MFDLVRGRPREFALAQGVVVERMRRRSHLAVHVLDDDVVDGVGEIRRRAQRDSRSHRVPHERERRPCGIALEVLAPAGGLSGQDLMLRLAEDCPAAALWLLDAEGRPLPAILEVESGSRSETHPSEIHPAQDGRYRPGAVVELMLAIPGG